ncbi:MAG: MBL fold metallo-hydrolase [Candidatus Firestonebacteria bacterium]|nr:MBL fold metallo-hydrolase [Candidatus Firestonebacteria bacterium]
MGRRTVRAGRPRSAACGAGGADARAGIREADALLLTHAHADHVGGLDDLRIFSERSGQDFPVYGPAAALARVRERFGYVFRRTQAGGGKPRLSLRPVSQPFYMGRLRVVPLPVWHGRLRVFGYRLGRFAYITDVSKIPPATYPKLRGLDVLVLDALRHEPHETHFHVARALAEAARIGAQRTYFTHICHRLPQRETQALLPKNVFLAYDGLVLNLP